jgi:DNA-binding response OmpR family regulator
MTEAPELALISGGDPSLRSLLSERLRDFGVARIVTSERRDALDPRLLAAVERGLLVAEARSHDIIARTRVRAVDWVILALAMEDDDEVVADALDAGADDVLRVPHSHREFCARLKARLRPARPDAEILSRVGFTPAELAIVTLLLDKRGVIVTRNELSQHLDRADWTYGDRKFDVHITKIRKKLHQSFGSRFTVQTVRSQGYRLCEAPRA